MLRLAWCLILTAFLGLAFGAQAAPAPVVDPDLPGVTANLELIPAGSLVIPMDNAHQDLTDKPFNLKAYGLVNALLLTNIPMKWAIAAGKAKDGIDFQASARRIAPTEQSATAVSFRAGPFIVHRDFVARALPVISAFGSQVAVYELTTNTLVDVRYTLGHKPQVLVLDDGGTDGIHTRILQEAGFNPSQYVVVSAKDVKNYASNSCYTIVTAPHYKEDHADTEASSIRAFLVAGGNFLAQCAAVRTYENNETFGHFHGSEGLKDDNRGSDMNYVNADMAFNQFEGELKDTGGSLQDWTLVPGSSFVNNGHMLVQNQEKLTSMVAAAGKLQRGKVGSMVFYLGGHDYKGEQN